MSASSPTPRIDPSSVNIWPGGGWSFQMYVGSKLEPNATWSVLDPAVGSINPHTGDFTAEDEPYRNSMTIVKGTTADGKLSATAEVHIIVGRGLMAGGPVFVDDFWLPGLVESVRWNDRLGRRAAVLITEALWQLPKSFLDAVGEVSIIRAKTLKIGSFGESGIRGMHLPLAENIVLLADDSNVSHLLDKPQITDKSYVLLPTDDEYGKTDYDFVWTLVHELAHIALTRRVFSLIDRVWLESVLRGSILNPAVFISSVIDIYLHYYSPLAGQDFCSDFGKVTGWVVNNPNPLSLFWKDVTVLPNVVTGLKLFGTRVGLRNKNLTFPIPLPPSPPLTYDQKEAYCRGWGFASYYGSTDVHEDWAESVAAMLMGDQIANDPMFAPRREFILKSKILPRVFKPVVPGAILNAWAHSMGRPEPDVTEWGAYFGNFAGKPRFAAPIPIDVAKAEAMKVKAVELPGTAGEGEEDRGSLGEGGGVEHPDMDAYADAVKSLTILDQSAPAQEQFTEIVDNCTKSTSAEVAALDIPLRESTTMDFLRTAECHGDGLLKIELPALKNGEKAVTVPGFPVAIGDVICDADRVLYVVAKIDDQGRIVQIAGTPRADEKGRLSMTDLDSTQLRYLWRPDHHARTWAPVDAPRGEYSNLQTAMVRIVRLWGETEGSRKQELGSPGGFITEALDAAGLKHENILDMNGDDVAVYLNGYGSGMRARAKGEFNEVAVGDFVRITKKKLWSVCTRAFKGEERSGDVLVQGGLEGDLGEPEGAVILLYGVGLSDVGYLWRPSSERRH